MSLATAALVRDMVGSAKYGTIDELLRLIQALGKRLVEANPKGQCDCASIPNIRVPYTSQCADIAELAAGNIIRRILRLIREEYRAAISAHLSAPPSTPGTPYLGPTTPGIHVPSNHYLSNVSEFQFASPGTSAAAVSAQTSLSNFVAMRHSRAQLERSGSTLDMSALGPLTTSLANTGFQSPSASTSPRMGGQRSLSRAGSVSFFSEAQSSSWDANSKERDEFMRQSGKLKPVLIQAIDEVIGELETTHEEVARGAKEHIHSS